MNGNTRLKLSNNNSVSCTATKGRDFFFLLDSRSLKRSPSSLTWSLTHYLHTVTLSVHTSHTPCMHSCRSRCTCSSLLFSRSLPLEASSSFAVHPEFRSIVEARVRAVMLRAFVFFALHSLSALASSSGQQSSPWFIGCVSASSSLGFHGPTGVGARDLDPVACSAHCLDEGWVGGEMLKELSGSGSITDEDEIWMLVWNCLTVVTVTG